MLRGASFLAHALPHGAFAGAAGATLLGLDPILGMGVFALGGALAVTTLGRRGRSDVVIALALVVMLAFGALFLSLGNQYSAEVFALLFGQILGVSSAELAAHPHARRALHRRDRGRVSAAAAGVGASRPWRRRGASATFGCRCSSP